MPTTDGLPNRVPLDPRAGGWRRPSLKAAQVKDVGALIYTIGFGHADAADIIDRVYPWLLEQCASAPSMAFIEPRADRLASSTPASPTRLHVLRGGTIGRSPGRDGGAARRSPPCRLV
ncbi:MAG: hypothetical protein U0470_00405 [Anaerolineae bacterium]